MQILVFGDSIVYGLYDKSGGGWVERLRKFIDQKLADGNHYYTLYNLGIDGDNSKNLLKRMDFEIQQRQKEIDPLIIISFGGRDAIVKLATGKPDTSRDKFEENVQKILDTAKKYTSKVLFVGIVGPRDESKLNPIPWKPEYAVENKYARDYNEIEKNICKKNGVHFIDIFGRWEKLDYKSLIEDGAHPNPKGHKKIFSLVCSYLMKNKLL